MLKVAILLAVVVVGSAQYYHGGYALGGVEAALHHHPSAPSHHGPFSSSVSTGIRRYGSTAGGYYAKAAYAHHPYADYDYGYGYHHGVTNNVAVAAYPAVAAHGHAAGYPAAGLYY